VEKIKRLHLLLAFYNAMQPGGVSRFSGWEPGRSAHPAGGGGARNGLPTAILAGSNPRRPMTLLGSKPEKQCARQAGFAARPWLCTASLPGASSRSPTRFASQLAAACSRCVRICICTRHGLTDVPSVAGEKGLAGAGARAAGETRDLRLRRSTSGIERWDESVLIRGAAAGFEGGRCPRSNKRRCLDVGADGSLRFAFEGIRRQGRLRIKG